MEIAAFAALQTFAGNVSHGIALTAAAKLITAMEVLVSAESSMAHPDCRLLLKELDLAASISTVKAMIVDLKPLLIRHECGSSVKVCVENLQLIIDEIQELIDVVNKKTKEYQQSWSAYIWSNADVSAEMKQLTKCKQTLDHRIQLLTQTVTIELQAKVLLSSPSVSHCNSPLNEVFKSHHHNHNHNHNNNNNSNGNSVGNEEPVVDVDVEAEEEAEEAEEEEEREAIAIIDAEAEEEENIDIVAMEEIQEIERIENVNRN